MITSTIDNPEPEKQTVRVRLLKSIFVKNQGAQKAGDIVELDATEAASLRAYNLFEIWTDPVAATE
ncbi:MAG: hypothetical protein WB696_31710 [Chthoniobacterales bacterium]